MKQVVSSAEAWRLAQAREKELAEEQGRDLSLDENGKIKPSREALDWVAGRYRVLGEKR